MSQLRRAALGDDFGYISGEQPPDEGGWLKLNTNESPLPPSQAVAPAIAAAAAGLRRYPDADAEPLRSALAAHHGVAPEQIFVANGADQVIDCCFRAFCSPGDAVAWAEPSYSLFAVLARLFSLAPRIHPLGAGWALPASLAEDDARLRFVVNPNSPTGCWLPPAELEAALAAAPGVVAVDEAYADFAPAGLVPVLDAHPRWLVLRTFSKGYALAGLRVGYAVGAAELVDDLRAVRDSYPVDRCAIAGAAAALTDTEHHRRIVDGVVAERGRLAQRLTAAGWEVTPSQANFLMARPPDGDAEGAASRLRAARILVRRLDTVPDRLRITVGLGADTDRLLSALGAAG